MPPKDKKKKKDTRKPDKKGKDPAKKSEGKAKKREVVQSQSSGQA